MSIHIILNSCLFSSSLKSSFENRSSIATDLSDFSSTPFSICRDMYRTDGLRAFYTGMLSTLCRETVGYFLFFGTYELARFYLTPEGKSKSEIGLFLYYVLYIYCNR